MRAPATYPNEFCSRLSGRHDGDPDLSYDGITTMRSISLLGTSFLVGIVFEMVNGVARKAR
jgi:hypothetical protein